MANAFALSNSEELLQYKGELNAENVQSIVVEVPDTSRVAFNDEADTKTWEVIFRTIWEYKPYGFLALPAPSTPREISLAIWLQSLLKYPSQNGL